MFTEHSWTCRKGKTACKIDPATLALPFPKGMQWVQTNPPWDLVPHSHKELRMSYAAVYDSVYTPSFNHCSTSIFGSIIFSLCTAINDLCTRQGSRESGPWKLFPRIAATSFLIFYEGRERSRRASYNNSPFLHCSEQAISLLFLLVH